MTYSTGSGDYNALMAAVLAVAVTDGWTTTGGLWPINKGNVRGVDWYTWTNTEADFTLLGGGTKTARYIGLSVGTSPADATNNCLTESRTVRIPNMEYSITSWAIYTDPTLCDYIHVVINFNNGVNGDCYGHFGFGELDKEGMTHTAVTYATASPKRGYAVNNGSGNTVYDWNLGLATRSTHGYTGFVQHTYSSVKAGNSIVFIIDPTVAPIPSSGWPALDTLLDDTKVLNLLGHNAGALDIQGPERRGLGADFKWNTWIHYSQVQPYSGAVSMGSLGFFIMQNTNVNATQTIYLGNFPNVRTCSMNSYTPGDQVSYAADNWDLFPWLRKTTWPEAGDALKVTSGEAGYALKRVV